MAIFEKVILKWEGAQYEVAPDRVMMLIATVEDHLTLTDLANGNPAGSKIAMAYSAALRYAGCNVTAERVYTRFFGNDDSAQVISDITTSLLVMMIPPEALRQKMGADDEPSEGEKLAGK